jgi:hypothetical protein
MDIFFGYMRERLKRKNNKRNQSLMNTTPCASAERGLSRY